MSTVTPRIGMVLPEGTDPAIIEVVSQALELVDARLNVIVVNETNDIAVPYDGQMVLSEDNDAVYVYNNGDWLFIPSGDNGHPNTAFVIGDIQAGDSGDPDPLRLNPDGGPIYIGVDDNFSMTAAGFKVTAMDSEEGTDITNLTINDNNWYYSGNYAQATFTAPPSGKVKVTATGQYNANAGSDRAYLGFGIIRPNDSEFQAPGGEGKQAYIQGGKSTPIVVDVVKGLTVGTEYRARTSQKREAGSDTVNSIWRKILVEPVY